MADELPYVLKYLGNRVADAVAGAGIPRARVHLDGPPQNAASEGQPFVVVQTQGGGSDVAPPVNGRGLTTYAVVVKVVSGGDTFQVGAPSGGFRPMAVANVLDAIQEALEHHGADVPTSGGESARITVKMQSAVRYAETPASTGGARWIHQGRQWRVLVRPSQRAYS
jgi:hypothetical protein